MYHEALQHLRKGDTILYPSDTTWVLGCDARNEKAIEKMLSLKQNPDNEQITILISNFFSLFIFLIYSSSLQSKYCRHMLV